MTYGDIWRERDSLSRQGRSRDNRLPHTGYKNIALTKFFSLPVEAVEETEEIGPPVQGA